MLGLILEELHETVINDYLPALVLRAIVLVIALLALILVVLDRIAALLELSGHGHSRDLSRARA